MFRWNVSFQDQCFTGCHCLAEAWSVMGQILSPINPAPILGGRVKEREKRRKKG